MEKDIYKLIINISYINRYITATTSDDVDGDKLAALVSCATPEVFEYFDHCQSFVEAETILEKLYVKQPNDIFARHLLRIAKQKSNQTLEDFRCSLMKLAKDCDFRDATALQYKDDMMRDSFINGLCSSEIRQRLLEHTTYVVHYVRSHTHTHTLEHKTLTMNEAFEQAMTLTNAKRDNRVFGSVSEVDPISDGVNAVELHGGRYPDYREIQPQPDVSTALATKSTCIRCGSSKSHDFKNCKAKFQVCFKCDEKGHYGRACNLQKRAGSSSRYHQRNKDRSAAVDEEAYVLCAAEPVSKPAEERNQALVYVEIKGNAFKALLDTGSSKSFINKHIAQRFNIKQAPDAFEVGMAQSTSNCEVSSICMLNLSLFDVEYRCVQLYVMNDLCVDI